MDLSIRRDAFKSYDDGTDALIMRTIKNVDYSGVTIGQYSFYGCDQLETANAINCTTINTRAFMNCTSLKSIEFSNIVTQNGGYCFYNCSALTKISLPSLEYINGAQNLFGNCISLKTVVLPSHYRTTQTYIFSGCTSLEIYDAGKPTVSGNYSIFGQYFFNNCAALHTIILRTETRILGLGNINAFTGTRFASGGIGGTIYIPKVLYDHLGDGTTLDYLSNANWNTINGYGTITWAPIEGSQYEHYYADGTPIPTGYQEVEWIEVNNSKLSTTIKLPNAPIEITGKCAYKRQSGNLTPGILGVSNNNLSIYTSTGYDDGKRYVGISSGISTSAVETLAGENHELDYIATVSGVGANNTITLSGTLDGQEFSISRTGTTNNYSNSNLYLLGTSSANFAGKMIGRIIIKSNDEILYNFMPCYKRLDKTIGVLETISGTFFSGGTSKGADVN